MKVNVKVVSRSKKERVAKIDSGLKVFVTAPAIEGKANKRVVEILAEYFNVKKYNVVIVKGKKQKDKVVEINGTS